MIKKKENKNMELNDEELENEWLDEEFTIKIIKKKRT